jgi:parallel beta-helix repeat protein
MVKNVAIVKKIGFIKNDIYGIIIIFFIQLLLLSGHAEAGIYINSCQDISSPDTYILSEDIINSGNTICIKITANNVSFDGAGHTVDGIDASGSKGVYVNNPYSQLTNVTIKNLTVTDWGYGINYENTRNGSAVGNNASSNYYGIQLSSSSNTNLINNTADSNSYFGIELSGSNNNLTGNNVKSYWGILAYPENNLIYNNRFNSSYNYFYSSNTLNTSKQPGENIIGGSYLGGNFWANPDGKGFSETCEDANSDGICDKSWG